jgi:hypothetical protein
MDALLSYLITSVLIFRIDYSDPIFKSENAMTGHVILPAYDWHLILTAERRYVDDKFLDQHLLEGVAALEYDAPQPFTAWALVSHGVVAISDQLAQDGRPLLVSDWLVCCAPTLPHDNMAPWRIEFAAVQDSTMTWDGRATGTRTN